MQFIGRSDDSEFNQISQEFRLSSNQEGRFTWVIGGNLWSPSRRLTAVVVDGTLGQPDIMRL